MLHSDALGITEQFVRQYTQSGCRRYAQLMALLISLFSPFSGSAYLTSQTHRLENPAIKERNKAEVKRERKKIEEKQIGHRETKRKEDRQKDIQLEKSWSPIVICTGVNFGGGFFAMYILRRTCSCKDFIDSCSSSNSS